ncbi:MAG: hypothetical protein OHK0038_12750 [Flammeovirgaceae bacterium]
MSGLSNRCEIDERMILNQKLEIYENIVIYLSDNKYFKCIFDFRSKKPDK